MAIRPVNDMKSGGWASGRRLRVGDKTRLGVVVRHGFMLHELVRTCVFDGEVVQSLLHIWLPTVNLSLIHLKKKMRRASVFCSVASTCHSSAAQRLASALVERTSMCNVSSSARCLTASIPTTDVECGRRPGMGGNSSRMVTRLIPNVSDGLRYSR